MPLEAFAPPGPRPAPAFCSSTNVYLGAPSAKNYTRRGELGRN